MLVPVLVIGGIILVACVALVLVARDDVRDNPDDADE